MRKCRFRLFLFLALGLCSAPGGFASAAPKDDGKAAQPFVFALLPDTGSLAKDHPEVFAAQTRWIKENRDKLNIVYVAHAGNVTATDSEKEWQNADAALKSLDGVVPYGLVGGPTDTPKPAEVSRDTGLLNKYFPSRRYKSDAWYSGCYGKGDRDERDNSNCYHVLAVAGMKFLVLYLEYGPRDEVIAWANQVAAMHPSHRIILVTHSYLGSDGRRITEKSAAMGPFLPPPQMNTGDQVWEKFVSAHRNFFLVLSSRGEPARLISEGREKNKVFQLTANYLKDAGNAGYLRLITFVPKDNKVLVSTYSPILGRSLKDDPNEFALDYDMSSRDESFSLVALPDTQFYTGVNAWMPCFTAQAEWIVRSRRERNIVFVMHEGDVTNTNSEDEWRNADSVMKRLDGVVPYGIVYGNHDVPNCGIVTRGTDLFNKYFPPERFRKYPGYGGCYEDRSDNSWQTFSAFGMKFLVLCLEYGPRDEAVEWADGIVKAHPDHRVILLTHSYLTPGGRRITEKTPGENPYLPRPQMNTGEQLWENLVSRHGNFFLTLSGHVFNVRQGEPGRLTSAGIHGNTVHQLAINYQESVRGGNGWLRILTFVPKEDRIYAWTYSPFADEYLRDAANEFTLDYDMSAGRKN